MPRRTLPEIPIRRVRAAIGGDKHALIGIDPNHPRMQRLRELSDRMITHLGGPKVISHPEKVLAARASMQVVLCEMLERSFIKGRKLRSADLLRYLAVVQSLRRTLVTLGLQRRGKPVESLDEYLRKHYPENTIDAEPVDAEPVKEAAE